MGFSKKEIEKHSLSDENLIPIVLISDEINRSIDDIWVATDLDTGENFEVHWSKILETTSKSILVDSKGFFRTFPGVHEEPGGIIKMRPSQSTRLRSNLRRLTVYMESIGCSAYSDLKTEHILDSLKYSIRTYTGGEKLIAYKTIKEFHQIIYALRDFMHVSGKEFTNTIPTMKDYLVVVESYCKEHNIDYITWLKGSSHTTVSVALGMLQLGHAMEVLESNKTRCLKVLFKALHDCKTVPSKNYFKEISSAIFPLKNKKNVDLLLTKKQYDNEFFTGIRKHLLSEFDVDRIDKLPFKKFPLDTKTISGINKYSRYVHGCAFIVFLCVTGARRGELETLTIKDIVTDDYGNKSFGVDNHVRFHSKIHKTNHSLSTKRDITGFSLLALDALTHISANKKFSESALFSYTFIQKNQKAGSKSYDGRCFNFASNCAGTNLRNFFYKHFSETMSDDITKECMEGTPHAYRHFFAEFAMRRFDGNVREALRDHFRHSYGSYMTNHYVSNKIYETVDMGSIQHDYLIELIGREYQAHVDHKKALYGPIGKWIRKQVSSFESLAPEELAAEIESIADKFDGRIEPHEYGYCVIKKATETQSNCYNHVTKTPMTNEAKWDLCGGCLHRLSLPNTRETIMRLGISATEMISDLENAGVPFLAKEFKVTALLAQKAIEDIDGNDYV